MLKKIIYLLLFLALLGCTEAEQPPVRIGFVGILSGHNAAIGDHCRDAAMLAVHEVNQQGGIAGRKVELIVKDISSDPEGEKIIGELLDADVEAIIGPMFSSSAVTFAPLVENSDVVMISPTAGTTLLNRIDDNLLRLYPGSDVTTKLLAEHMISESISQVSIVRDESNDAFTRNWEELFSGAFHQLGGKVVSSGSYLSERDLFLEVVSRAAKSNPQAFLFLASPVETALLCQQARKIGLKTPVFTSEWSVSKELITGGGRSVEGLRFFHALDIGSREKGFVEFKKAYRQLYHSDPIYPAILTYDAAHVLFVGIRQSIKTGRELKPILLEQKSIRQLQTAISFDRFGDVQREFFLTTIRDGEFRVLSR